MELTKQQKNQHLICRAGFGPSLGDLQPNSLLSSTDTYQSIIKASQKKPEYINVAQNLVNGFMMGIQDVKKQQEAQNQSEVKKKEFAKKSRDLIKSLNLQWLNEMVRSQAQLREKMSLFWHGHFACRNLNVYFQQLLLHDVRSNALGKFGDLLTAVSKSPGMLSFLNNQQNKKSHPNENFAREVMELFTLGRNNYTEQDVKEAARAFTGWGFSLKGEFINRPFQHDSGVKTIFGKTGNFDGDDVIKMLLERKETAVFITRKVYRYFVNDVPNEPVVAKLADRFYQSNYDISGLMNDIFTSTWFYDKKNIGAKIKSPVELLAGIRRVLPIELKNEEAQLLFQRALGQILFYPPNVAGWPGGQNWIDSSALMLRLRLPQIFTGEEVLAVNVKADDDQQMGMGDRGKQMEQVKGMQEMGVGKRMKLMVNIDWPTYTNKFSTVERPALYNALVATLLTAGQQNNTKQVVERLADKSGRDAYIRTVTVALMSTPEYQMC